MEIFGACLYSCQATVTNKKKKDNSKHTAELQLLEGLSRRYSPEATAAEATTEVRRLQKNLHEKDEELAICRKKIEVLERLNFKLQEALCDKVLQEGRNN